MFSQAETQKNLGTPLPRREGEPVTAGSFRGSVAGRWNQGLIALLIAFVLFAAPIAASAATFSQSDIVGAWHFLRLVPTEYIEMGSAGFYEAAYGSTDISAAGGVDGWYREAMTDSIFYFNEGSITLDPNGVVSGSITERRGSAWQTATVKRGHMSQDKTVMVTTETVYTPILGTYTSVLTIWVRDGGSFGSSELTGSWYLFTADNPAEFPAGVIVPEARARYGALSLDATFPGSNWGQWTDAVSGAVQDMAEIDLSLGPYGQGGTVYPGVLAGTAQLVPDVWGLLVRYG